jgi:hypothetical protein
MADVEAKRAADRHYAKRYRRRRRYGIYRRVVEVTGKVLVNLVERGYLDQRGDRADEAEAIETFLLDSLGKR